MTMKPTPSAFARLLRELSLCSGEELERALAQSAPMFARLSARAAPRILGTPHLPPAYFTMERAQRELGILVERELTRLCELAAKANGDEEEMGISQRDLAELLREELACAKSIGCLRRSTIQRLRAQAKLLSLGVCDAAELQACADSIRARRSAARLP
jgi:hypothetical protein